MDLDEEPESFEDLYIYQYDKGDEVSVTEVQTMSSTEAPEVDDGGPTPQWDHVDPGKGVKSWARPPVSPIDPRRDPIIFQQIDVDYVIDCGKPVVRTYGATSEGNIQKTATKPEVDTGNSVCAFVEHFEPYFYIEMPPNFEESDLNNFTVELQKRVNNGSNREHNVLRTVIEEKTNIWKYQFRQKSKFLKIYVQIPNTVAQCRSLLERETITVGKCKVGQCTTFESNVLFPLRFMIDCGISGGTWVEALAGKYSLVEAANKRTTAQIEIVLDYQNLINHAPEGQYARLAPLRILSVDIECEGRKGKFPDPQFDPVIQIASRVTCVGSEEAVVNNILTLKECSPIIGADVMSFTKESDLLLKWQRLLRHTDPDIIIGYNICNFDLPYLVNRAKKLKIDGEFEFWGRIKSSRIRMRNSQFSSKAYGTHEYKEITIEGRVQFDLLLTIQRDHKLSSYSLNSVSAHFLGEQKEDVHHSIIADLQNGNPETRRRLAVYCIKDAWLPQRLVDKLMYMYNYIEMARVTGVPFSYLLTRGQSIKVFSQLMRKARNKGFIIPSLRTQGQTQGVAFEGATVLEAQQGYYDAPVATLDFASLYPSIMMAHNLCYTTLVPKEKIPMMSPDEVETSPCGDTFVRSSVMKGLLPEVLEELLATRKRAKADLKKATDPFVKAVLDGRQLALKVSANSVYGFTGATMGKLPCLEISSSTTAYGREMIHHTKELVLSRYNKANGYEADCEVIYGDTDSVMVNFNVLSIERSMELGTKAAAEISATFPPPVKLEFEKVYCPYLLMSKKRYAGLLWTNPEKYDKMDTKGIESVRRDNCLLVRKLVTTSLEKLLIERDVTGALDYVKQTISDLLMNRLDMSELVVSKGLSREAGDYETKIAHVELAKKMMKRDPATAPGIGDRVPYVIIKATKGSKAYEKAEDPIFALDNNLPIDFQHYLDHHLAQPITRIFEPILKTRVRELLSGEHTRSVIVSTPSAASGGIMQFAKTRSKCLGCKAPLDPDRSTLCQHCEIRKPLIYLDHLNQVNDLEDAFGRLWTQCQTCQGSLLQDVLCTNRDCPIFYRRKKVRKDLSDAQKRLTKLND